MPSRKPPAGKGPAPAENLHIAATQRIVGKHRNNLRMPLEDVRYWINRALEDNGGSAEAKDLGRMREQLGQATGSSIAELAELTKRWPI